MRNGKNKNISPFDIEKNRQILARQNKLKELKNLYSTDIVEIKDLNKPKFWDEIYRESNDLKSQDPMTRDRIKTVMNFIPKGKKKLLDIGAGLGWVEELLDPNKEIYATDFSDVSVKYLQKKFRGNFSKQSLYNLKYPKNLFDIILALEVLEHIPPSKLFGVLKSIHSFLKKNGTLVVSVPMNEGLEKMEENPNGHVRMYTEDLIIAELKIAGFKTLEYKSLYAFGNLYRIKSLIARLIKTHKPNNLVLKAVKI